MIVTRQNTATNDKEYGMMKIRTFLNSKTKMWCENMTTTQNKINELIWQLDKVASRYELVWGVYRLESIADENLKAKVQAQLDKLNEAIQAEDVDALAVLVDGCIRMYDALEKYALANGHKPQAPDYWELKVGSKIYRIVKMVNDHHRAQKGEGVEIVSLEELVNLYDKRLNGFLDKVAKNKSELSEKAVADINWETGDPLPF